jgi:hypothetical protein
MRPGDCPAGLENDIWSAHLHGDAKDSAVPNLQSPAPQNDARVLALACLMSTATGCLCPSTRPDVSGNWMLNGGKTTFGEWHLTEAGERRVQGVRLQEGRSGAEVHRHELDARLAQSERARQDHAEPNDVRLQYEWMDIDRRIPLVDPTRRA